VNPRAQSILGLVLAAVVFVLAAEVIPSLPFVSSAVEAIEWLTRSNIIQLVFLVGSLVAMLVLGRWKPGAYGLKRSPWRDVWRAVGVSAAISLGVVVATMIVVSVLGPRGAGTGMPGAGSFAKIFVSVWLLASTAEEMLFRGLLLGSLSPLSHRAWTVGRCRISLPVTIAAALFGLVHLGLLRMVPAPMVVLIVVSATVAGLVAGYYREKTGSLVPAVAAHMTFNVVSGGIVMILSRVMMAQPPG
jgi:membrane protease YdiL (CAAX protease family)